MRIGVDLDNTIAGYDRLFARLAAERGVPGAEGLPGKRAVRDRVRALYGDVEWQKLQAEAYGRRMAEAELLSGVAGFFRSCRENALPVFIVSHKTRHAAMDPDGVDLRQAARSWMEDKGFFDRAGFGLHPEQVFFEDTREDKVSRIADLDCSHFIDDLVEVFEEPAFPERVERLLYAPDGDSAGREARRYPAFGHWNEIREHLLGPAH